MKRKEEYIAAKIANDCLDDMKMSASTPIDEIPDRILKLHPEYDIQSEAMINTITGCVVFIGYLKTRQAFKLHPVLVHELIAQTDLAFAVQNLHLPYNDMYFDIASSHISIDNKEIVGVYVHNELSTQQLAFIALVKVGKNDVILMHTCMDYSSGLPINELIHNITSGYDNEQIFAKTIFAILSYISSDEPDIEDKGREISIRSYGKQKRPSATRLWNVGYRYVKEYQKILGHEPTIEEIKEISKNSKNHNSPRRHLRAAHWHTYLYGPKKSKRKVLWYKLAGLVRVMKSTRFI